MAILGVDDFKSKLRGGGARPNLFKATINFPTYANGDVEITSFLCEAAQLPGSTIGTKSLSCTILAYLPSKSEFNSIQ